MGPVLAEDFALFQIPIIANTDFCHTHFTPAGFDAAGHMLEVIIIEKDTLQIIDDHVDCPVGSIPNLAVIGAPRCGDPDVNMGLFKARDTDLCLLDNGFMDHAGPVLFYGTGQLLQPRKWLRYHQADHFIRIGLGDRHFPDSPLFRSAERTRSAASLVSEARYPTIVKVGSPSATSASTVTFLLSIPLMAADKTVLNMWDSPVEEMVFLHSLLHTAKKSACAGTEG